MPTAPAVPTTVGDVDAYLHAIRRHNQAYNNVVDKLAALKKKRGGAQAADVAEKEELLQRRTEVKADFIASKQRCRALLALLEAQGGGPVVSAKAAELKELQDDFRAIDVEFKHLGFMADRAALLDVADSSPHDGGRVAGALDIESASNADLLGAAHGVEEASTGKLKAALATVAVAQGVASEIGSTLEDDREKIGRISTGLDEIQAELGVARMLITRYFKRLYTDRVLIAFAFLLVVGIVAIIIYATVNEDQQLFRVPDEVKPPLKPSP